MKRIVISSIIAILASASWSSVIGRKCPNSEVLKRFDDGTYLLERNDDKMIVCRHPDKRDSLLVGIGIYTRDSLYERVSGVRYFKYNDSRYSIKDLKEAFYTDLDNCRMRMDGLFECYSTQYNGSYYSITDSKGSFPWIEYRPEFQASICGSQFGLGFDFLMNLSKGLSVDDQDASVNVSGLYLYALFAERMDSLRLGKAMKDEISIGDGVTYLLKAGHESSVSILKCSTGIDSTKSCKYLTGVYSGSDGQSIFSIIGNCKKQALQPKRIMENRKKMKKEIKRE